MKAIVRFFRQRAIKSFLKRKKPCILPDITKYPTLALLLDEDQFKRHKELEQTVMKLFSLKRLTFVVYVEALPQNVLQSEKYILLTKNDFNFWGLVKKEKWETFLSLPFDLVIDFTRMNDGLLTNRYIMALINNTFRVSFRHRSSSFYDLVIDSKNDDDMLKRIEILHDYLSMLLGKR